MKSKNDGISCQSRKKTRVSLWKRTSEMNVRYDDLLAYTLENSLPLEQWPTLGLSDHFTQKFNGVKCDLESETIISFCEE